MVMLLALLFGSSITAVFQNPSGSWRLNWDLSEDVPFEETGFAAPPELLMPSEKVVLSMTETSVTFYDSDGTKRRYRLSGDRERSVLRGFEVYTRARWDGHRLRLEVSPKPELVLIEDFDRTANQLRLSVAVSEAGRRAGPVIRYTYDSAYSH